MSEPTRFLKSARYPRARELLQAGLDDGPPPEALGRAAAAVGVTLAAAAVAAPASAAAINGAASTAVVAGKASGTSSLVLGKWLLSGILGGVLVSGTTAVVQRVQASHPPRELAATAHESAGVRATRSRVASRAVPPPSNAVTEAASAESSENTPNQAGAPSANGAAVAPSGATAPGGIVGAPGGAPVAGGAVAALSVLAPPESSASRALGVEAARIDAARRALAAGDVRRALVELDWYEHSRVIGVLDREAALLRIEALVQRGDGPRAVEFARAYLARHPHDAYTARLNELIARGGSVFPAGEGINR